MLSGIRDIFIMVTRMNTSIHVRACTHAYIIMITLFLIILFYLLTASFINFVIIKIKYMYILPEQALK
jgi:hypothetical protein